MASKKSAASETPPTPSPEKALSKAQIAAATSNSPALAPNQVKLGDRTFAILDLEYDEYLEFTSHLEPLLKSVAGMVTKRANISIPGLEADMSEINVSFLMKFCGKALPEMAVIVLNMEERVAAESAGRPTDPAKLIDIAWVKKNAKNPMVLAGIVMKQIAKNNMIMDFLDFFVQVLPTVMQLSQMQKSLTT
jgi:hypothetical protein